MRGATLRNRKHSDKNASTASTEDSGFATRVMPESRTGKRKEHSLDAGDLDSGYTDIGLQHWVHAPKQQKQPLADPQAFCGTTIKPASPRSYPYGRQQAVRPAFATGSSNPCIQAPNPFPIWQPPQMSAQMQAAHLKQQHASQMALLLQQHLAQDTSLAAQLAAHKTLQECADRQLCDAAFAQAELAAKCAQAEAAAAAAAGQGEAAAKSGKADPRCFDYNLWASSPGTTVKDDHHKLSASPNIAAQENYCWSSSPTAGLTKPAAAFPCTGTMASKAVKAPELVEVKYGSLPSYTKPAPPPNPADMHRQTSALTPMRRNYEYNSYARYNNGDDDDAALQAALAASLAPFGVEDILRSTAEPLPLRAQDGVGVVWQNDVDTTVQAHKTMEVQSKSQAQAEPSPDGITPKDTCAQKHAADVKNSSTMDSSKGTAAAQKKEVENHNGDMEILKALTLKEVQAYGPEPQCTLDDLCEDVDHQLHLQDSQMQIDDSVDSATLSLACDEQLAECDDADGFEESSCDGYHMVPHPHSSQPGAAPISDEWILIDDIV